MKRIRRYTTDIIQQLDLIGEELAFVHDSSIKASVDSVNGKTSYMILDGKKFTLSGMTHKIQRMFHGKEYGGAWKSAEAWKIANPNSPYYGSTFKELKDRFMHIA